jgi:hypothetical protein
VDEQPDLDGYGEAGQRGYGQQGYSDPRPDQPGYVAPPPEYGDPEPEYSDMRPEYAGTRPEYEAPRADYQGAGYDRAGAGVAERRGTASRPGRAGQRSHPEREIWDRDPFSESDESEVPPWAGPSIYATRAGGRRMGPPTEEQAEAELETAAADDAGSAPAPRRRGRGRAAAARLRKSRRRVYILCGSAIVIAVIIAVVAVIVELPSPKPKSDFISSLQPGEFKAVPSACTAVSASVLSQNLDGSARKVTPTGTGPASSQCSFTVDHPPVFRVLQITIQAFQPSLYAAGNGSATAGAVDAYASARLALTSPSKKSPLPKATVTNLTGLGQEAVSAVQILRQRRSRTVDDLFTVVARERNVLITVTLEAQAKGGGYGPVSQPTVASGTQALARAVMTKAQTEPTVK